MIVKYGLLQSSLYYSPEMIKRIQRIDEGIEVYELKQSLLWDRMIRKAKCIQ